MVKPSKAVTVMPVEPTMPPQPDLTMLPSREEALRQAIGHLRFVHYAIDCVNEGGLEPAATQRHVDCAAVWAQLAGAF